MKKRKVAPRKRKRLGLSEETKEGKVELQGSAKPKPTIAELEETINGPKAPIEVLPNGEIRAVDGTSRTEEEGKPLVKCPVGFKLCGESECRWWSDLNGSCSVEAVGDESYNLRIHVTRIADTLRELQETGEALVRAIGTLKDAASGTSSSLAKLTDLVESRLELEQLEKGKG